MSEEGFIKDGFQDRQRLIFLIENDMVKGKFELLYKLFRREVKELSLLGASKVITANLGIRVGIQTMRTLRSKCHEFDKVKGQRSEPIPLCAMPSHKSESDSCHNEYHSIVKEMDEFKPMDVFSETLIKSTSLIKWAGKTNS